MGLMERNKNKPFLRGAKSEPGFFVTDEHLHQSLFSLSVNIHFLEYMHKQ